MVSFTIIISLFQLVISHLYGLLVLYGGPVILVVNNLSKCMLTEYQV